MQFKGSEKYTETSALIVVVFNSCSIIKLENIDLLSILTVRQQNY